MQSLDTATITGINEIQDRIRVINSPTLRKRILGRIATRIVTKSKRRIRDEIDLEGRPWAPRSAKAPKKLKKQKMMRKLYKLLVAFDKNQTSVRIGFKGIGKAVAVLQQKGFTRNFTRASFLGLTNTTSKASPEQAIKLKALGYRRPDGKVASLSWIRANLTVATAGAIIIKLRGTPAKDSWSAVIPPRSFLGITAQDKQDIDAMIVSEINYWLQNHTSI